MNRIRNLFRNRAFLSYVVKEQHINY